MKFRKRPLEIEAIQWDDTKETFDRILAELNPEHADGVEHQLVFSDKRGWISVKTINGYATVSKGEWVCRGIEGELYPCKDSIFRETYEPVKE